MSKKFKIKCPLCGNTLYYIEKKKDVVKFQSFSTKCDECGEFLKVDISNKMKINVEPMNFYYDGNPIGPYASISI